MAIKLDFYSPVQYGNEPVSLGRKLAAYADDYLHLRGTVAVVDPTSLTATKTFVKLEEGQNSCFSTLLKVISYVTIILPVIAFVIKLIGRSCYSFYIKEVTAFREKTPSLPPPKIDSTHVPHPASKTTVQPPDSTPSPSVKKKTVQPPDSTSSPSVKKKPSESVSVEKPRLDTAPKPLAELQPRLHWVTARAKEIECSFAEETVNGKLLLVPVQQSTILKNHTCSPYRGSAAECLFNMLHVNHTKNHLYPSKNFIDQSPIQFVLNHPSNEYLSKKQFLEYLLTPNKKKSEKGVIPLYTLQDRYLIEILELARKVGFPINVTKKESTSGESLYSVYAGSTNNTITPFLLALNPEAIEFRQENGRSFFEKAALNGFKEEAELLLAAMRKDRSRELDPRDQWIAKIFLHDTCFTKEEYLGLPTELRDVLRKIATVNSEEDFLLKISKYEPVPNKISTE